MQQRNHGLIVTSAIVFGIVASPAFSNEELAMNTAKGTFEVKIIPLTVDNAAARNAGIGRNAIEKRLRGDIEGVSHAEMLYSGDPTGYGSYVAIEKIDGSLKGRTGSFVLMHSGVMVDRQPDHWVVRVVPGSGTDQLQGLSGTMQIIIADGNHSYDLSFALPNDP